jgi:hypothetical protein
MNTSHDFWPALKARVEKAIESRASRVLTGKLSFQDYQIVANEIAGLKAALDIGDELASGKQPKAEDKPTT